MFLNYTRKSHLTVLVICLCLFKNASLFDSKFVDRFDYLIDKKIVKCRVIKDLLIFLYQIACQMRYPILNRMLKLLILWIRRLTIKLNYFHVSMFYSLGPKAKKCFFFCDKSRKHRCTQGYRIRGKRRYKTGPYNEILRKNC